MHIDLSFAIMLLLPIAFMLLFVAYYFAFEYSRYKTAKMLAEGLGGRAVFRLGRSQMRRDHDGVQERAWIVPDDKMAWGSLLSALRPPAGLLFLQRDADPGFRFHIEPRTGMLWRTISLGSLKDAEFTVPQLDQSLRLRTNRPAEAASCFSAPETQHALVALFGAGFIQLKGDHGAIVASMKGISADDLSPGNIDRYLSHLRSFQEVCRRA
ncbi:MAG: hypothetical protein NTW68_01790 [candidate division NC10 bacterium]|nr:hypothetical protein [candidate division NC10 bacterium]